MVFIKGKLLANRLISFTHVKESYLGAGVKVKPFLSSVISSKVRVVLDKLMICRLSVELVSSICDNPISPDL